MIPNVAIPAELESQVQKLLADSNRPVLVALDGRSGVGKSTIAAELAEQFDCVHIVSDNFWVGGSDEEWSQRTPKQKAELAIDWRRMRTEALLPLLAGGRAAWRSFDWQAGKGLAVESITAGPTKLILLDGAYSTRSELLDIIDLAVLITVSDDTERRARLINREGADYMATWHRDWDAAEDYYYTCIRPRSAFDLVISN
jgi:uridine kinase